jgi:hypothetical protein
MSAHRCWRDAPSWRAAELAMIAPGSSGAGVIPPVMTAEQRTGGPAPIRISAMRGAEALRLPEPCQVCICSIAETPRPTDTGEDGDYAPRKSPCPTKAARSEFASSPSPPERRRSRAEGLIAADVGGAGSSNGAR